MRESHPVWLTLGGVLATVGGAIVAGFVVAQASATNAFSLWHKSWFLIGFGSMCLGLSTLVWVAVDVGLRTLGWHWFGWWTRLNLAKRRRQVRLLLSLAPRLSLSYAQEAFSHSINVPRIWKPKTHRVIASFTMPVEAGSISDEAAALIAEGEDLKDALLAARRSTTMSAFGGSPAVNSVAQKIKAWNRRVAELVDSSDLAFSEKMALDIYNDPVPFTIGGASAKRLAEVLEHNIGTLSRLSAGHT